MEKGKQESIMENFILCAVQRPITALKSLDEFVRKRERKRERERERETETETETERQRDREIETETES